MALIIDTRIGGDRSQFATQVGNVPNQVYQQIEESFIGGETDDFYEGLLAGFINSYQIFHNIPPEQAVPYIGAIVAYLSEQTLKKSKEQTLNKG